MGELFLNRKDFFLNCFFKWAKLAKFIRYEAAEKLMWDTRCELKGASISITKFTEMGWNDCVFEHTEEQQRCSGCVVKLWSRKVVKLWSCEDVILKYFTEEILHFVVLRSEWQGYIFYSWLEICFNGRIVFESQRFFFELLF